ncbi:MAG: hypothetical protein IPP51_03595 [Bacteroidetes bacterium]|nr:hypothetical protein [Bacteroidota bacterium]
MLKRLLPLFLLLFPFISFAQFSPESDPHRGIYADDFLKLNSANTEVDSSKSILTVDANHDGIFEKEDALLSYACENHITYLALYDTHRIIGKHRMIWNENSAQYEDLEKHLCRFITKAKSEYGISEIGAIGGSPQYFDSLSTYMDRYPLTAPVHLDSTITSSPYFNEALRIAEKEYHSQSPEARRAEKIKQSIAIMNFNSINSCGASIDVLNVEYEFWGDCANEFQNFYDIAVSMNSLKQINNQLHPSHPLRTEAYLALLGYCNSNPTFYDVVKTIDGCSSCAPFPGTTNPHPALIDRILLSFLQANPYNFDWSEESLFENNLTQDSTDMHPIFYAESQDLGGSFDFMGRWFPQAPTNTIFLAENYFFYHFLNFSGSSLGTPSQNNVQSGGAQWFAYSFMKENLRHPKCCKRPDPFALQVSHRL